MPNAAQAHRNSTPNARPMRQLGVYVAAEPGTAPVEADLRPDVICTSITHLAGSRLSRAEFVVDLGREARNIENRALTSNASRQIEVWLIKSDIENEDDSIREKCLFWGELIENRISLNEGQQEQWTAIIHPRKHFGGAVKGQRVWDQLNTEITTLHLPLEFNPDLDGLPQDNRWPASATNNPDEFSIWVDPESTRTAAAITYLGSGDPAAWSLDFLLQTLTDWINSAEDFIDNPTFDSLQTQFLQAPVLRDLVLTSGGHLPEYLDAILPPFGYAWYVLTSGTSSSTRTLTTYQRGAGTEKTLKLQAFGSESDPTQDALDTAIVNWNFADTCSRLHVFGALKQREVTVELYPAWSPDDDGTQDPEDIQVSVGRKWVANEGAAYKDLRPTIGDPPELPDMGPPKNRVMEDCLTTRDGQRLPVQVQYSTDNGSSWQDLRTLTTDWRPLTTEIGLYFTAVGENALIPEILDLDNFRLQMTGTVTSDYRIEFQTDLSSDAPIDGEVERVINVPTQFVDRQRQETGDFASVLTGAADERDDSSAIETYANRLLENETLANVTASLRLFGLHFDYQIGDVLTSIDGRAISLNRAAGAATTRYLQVVGISYQLDNGQYTVLHVEQYDI